MDPDSASTGSAHADDQDEQALMAQAMGFASFGAQHPNKKRRYNPRADATGVSLPPKPSATGANSTALGAGPTTGSNADKISLDDDEEASAASAQVRPASLPQRPAAPSGGYATSREPRRGQDHSQRGNWYEGYYDPSSNENPWGRLEKARGMSSTAPWLLRGVGGGGPSAASPVA